MNTTQSPRAPAANQSPRTPDRRFAWLLGGLFWVVILSIIPPDLADTQRVGLDWGAPSATGRSIKLALLACSFYVIFQRGALAGMLLRQVNRGLLALVALTLLSVAWSISPDKTIARCVALLTLLSVGFAFCLASWHPRRMQSVVRPILTLFLVGSLLFGLAYPDLVLERGDSVSLRGAWHGLAVTKNEFGQLASLCLLFWLHPWIAREMRFRTVLPGIAIAFTCLALSRSSASYLSTGVGTVLMLIVMRTRPALIALRRGLVYALAALVGLYGLVALHIIPGLEALLGPVAALAGRDSTFSSRTFIWQVIIEHIKLSPFLGTGYAAYWIGPQPGSPSSIFLKLMYFYPTESHNGYLEIVNDLGLVGLAALGAYIIIYLRHGLRLMSYDRGQAAMLLAIFFHQLAINLSESVWLTTGGSFAVLSLATFALARALLDVRLRAGARRPAPAAPARVPEPGAAPAA